MNYLGVFCVSIGLCFPVFAHAESEKNEETKMEFSGFIDGSYNNLNRSNMFTSGVYDRVYDLNENGFTLQQLAGTFSYLPTPGVGLFLNGMIGRDAIVSNAYGMGTWTDSPDFGVDLTQAYIRIAGNDKFTLDFGKFTTLNGVEVIAPINDTNFSRSILFGYAGPFTALGGRATYTVDEQLKLTAGLNDGWDTIRDFSRGKTVELQVAYTFNPTFSVALTGYNGEQRAVDRTSTGPIGSRTLIDFVGTININDNLTLMGNYDNAWQSIAALADGDLGRARWSGFAGYINYKFNDQFRTSFRGETFNDNGGFRTGVSQVWKELTITLAYIPERFKEKLEVRAEARHDFSNVDSFMAKHGPCVYDNLQSFAVEAFYKFE